MVTTELGACEWFVWDLRRSNLIDRGQLDQIVGEFMQANPRAEPPALAEFLIAQNVISQFQAERLLQGKTQGFVLGPFTLMDALGAGSMGTVYKAMSKTDNCWYAVKVLPRRSMWNVRIARRKVRAFENCRHPAVVPFVDVGTSGGMHYLAWPFVEGDTLDKVVQTNGRLPADLAARLTLQMAEGLEVCHHQGLFHGLFKPSNVMVGAGDQVFILDLGIGALLAETEGESLVDTMSTANSVASGLDCASPESIMDPTNLTPVGDQYSLGCTLYYCLSGQFPFPDGTAAEKMMAHQFKEPTPLVELAPETPPALIEIVERLMQKEPAKRYGNTNELVEVLRPLAGASKSRSGMLQRPRMPQPPGAVSSAHTNTPPMGGLPRSAMPTVANMPAPRSALPTMTSMPASPRSALPTMASMQPAAHSPIPSMGHAPRASHTPIPVPPAASGGLPSRQTMKMPIGGVVLPNNPGEMDVTVSINPASFAPEPPRVVPGGAPEEAPRNWEGLRSVGMVVGALGAAVLAWFVASQLF